MGGIRNFTGPEGHFPAVRDIDNDAPQQMRQELIDHVFGLAEREPDVITADRLYRVIGQSLGVGVSGNPYAGYRYASGRDIRGVDWPRVYDLICRLWPEFGRVVVGFQEIYREGVNRILAAYGIAWDLGADGRLHRVLPAAAQAQIEAAITELSDPAYAPALPLFNAARDAYDDRPRRDRDGCSNVFDAMESVAKIKYNRPDDTFGQVKNHVQQNNLLRQEIIDIFTAMNRVRNGHFGHGMAVQFALTPAEVDFVYLTCIGSILLLRRTP